MQIQSWRKHDPSMVWSWPFMVGRKRWNGAKTATENRPGNQHLTRLDSMLDTCIYIIYSCKSFKEIIIYASSCLPSIQPFIHIFHSYIHSTNCAQHSSKANPLLSCSIHCSWAMSIKQWFCCLQLIVKSPISRGKAQGIFGQAMVCSQLCFGNFDSAECME